MVPFSRLDTADYRLPDRDLDHLLSPALILYLDRVRENLRRMLAYTGSADRWRPHVKTTKTPAVFAEMLAVGLRSFKCATLREARCLLEATGRSRSTSLLAYPLVGPALSGLGLLAREFPQTRISVLCESPDLVIRIPESVSIFVDLDPGMRQTGIPLASRARSLSRSA